MTNFMAQSSAFFKIPTEIRLLIFNECIREDSNLSTRLVCKNWVQLIDGMIKTQWEHFKKTASTIPYDLPRIMVRLEQSNLPAFSKNDSAKHHFFFRALNLELKSYGAIIPKGRMRTSSEHFFALQRDLEEIKLNKSLMLMWKRMMPHMHTVTPHLTTSKEISEWLKNSETEEIRASITRLDLSDLGIRFIPEEICYLRNLHILNLSKNHIDQLPLFIKKLNRVTILHLQDNDLTKLPEDFATWTHLQVVFVDDNPLDQKSLIQVQQLNRKKLMPYYPEPMEIDTSSDS